MFDTFTQKFPRDYTAAYTIQADNPWYNYYNSHSHNLMRGNCSLKMSISPKLFLFLEPKGKLSVISTKNDVNFKFGCFTKRRKNHEKVATAEKKLTSLYI